MSELVNGFDASIGDEMAKVGPAGIDIAYQRLGNPEAPGAAHHGGRRAIDPLAGRVLPRARRPRPASHPLRQSRRRALHPPDRRPAAGPARGARRRPLVGLVHALRHGCRCGGIAGRARHREGAHRRRVHGRRDRADHGDRASGPRPLAHLDDVDNGQHVGRAALRRRCSAKCSADPGGHPRRSDSADAPGTPRRRLAGISGGREGNRRASRPRLRPLPRSDRHRSSGDRDGRLRRSHRTPAASRGPDAGDPRPRRPHVRRERRAGDGGSDSRRGTGPDRRHGT